MKENPQLRNPSGRRSTPQHNGAGNAALREATGVSPAEPVADSARREQTEPDGLKLLLLQFRELREYAAYYAAAKTDGVRCAARNAIRGTVLAGLGFVALAGLIVLASWLVLSGIAEGLGTLFGDRRWIGTLLTGVAALAGVGAALQYVVIARRERDRGRMVDKYETRQTQHRERVGRDARDGHSGSVAGGE